MLFGFAWEAQSSVRNALTNDMDDSYNSSMSERRISEARESFSTTINRVAFGGERVVLTRHGRRVAAVVPVEDLELLEALEDAADLDDARAALADPANREPIPWTELKAKLGL